MKTKKLLPTLTLIALTLSACMEASQPAAQSPAPAPAPAATAPIAQIKPPAAIAATPPATRPTTTTTTANPYLRVTPPAPTVANTRDQQPFTPSRPANLNANLPTLFITGDSTACTGDPQHRGWGAILIDYFDTSKVNLVNMAVSGARFNSYDNTWNQVLAALKPGDFVVIQFGQNSGPLAGTGEETQGNVHTHGWYLRKFINDVKAKKAIPIAATLTLRDLWLNGKVERLKEQVLGQGGMSDWTRQVAAQEKVLLLDHSNIIGDIYDKLGPTEGDKLFGDHYLHTNCAGAIVNAEAFIAGLKTLDAQPLLKALNPKGQAIPAYKP